jgi:hypothetical protein
MLLLLAAAHAADAPEISRSVGERGGVVVLWPRVLPATTDPALLVEARRLQARLAELAATAAPSAPRDVRPEPERVCPRQGCTAAALGAVLYHAEGGCIAVVTVSPPGPSAATLVPWAGVVELKAPTSAFREPPESQLSIRDMVPCAELVAATPKLDEPVLAAIRTATGP